jgi:hypothetical protein
MKKSLLVTVCGTAAAFAAATAIGLAQRGATLAPDAAARRWEIEKELQSIAVVERKVMMPMRDGVRLATDIYRPRGVSGPLPTILMRLPYNKNAYRPVSTHANLFAGQGYAVVASDYQGLGTPGGHPWMAVRPEAISRRADPRIPPLRNPFSGFLLRLRRSRARYSISGFLQTDQGCAIFLHQDSTIGQTRR